LLKAQGLLRCGILFRVTTEMGQVRPFDASR
jgi:hypothetical protein